MKSIRFLLGLVFLLSQGLPAIASSTPDAIQVRMDHPVSRGVYPVAVGSQLRFELPNQNTPRSGLFLGRVVKSNGQVDSYMLLDPKTMNVLYVPAGLIQIADRGLENVLDPYAQVGGTCTGYAINHFLVQTAMDGFRGNGALLKTLSTEEGRTSLLADSINQYYLVLQHRYSIRGILDGYGKRFGFHCQNHRFDSAQGARNFLLSRLAQGAPVLISFNIGTQMRTSPFDLLRIRPASYAKLDRRLWVPRKVGERNGGGHSIVAASVFDLNGRPGVVVIDSDWSEPRIWDITDYLDEHTAIQEVEMITCS
ncbi:MAG: hypothetical protein ACJ763_00900 [Bdellovibrionia bacterium]